MKYAAHFWLRPDGSVGKFPVLTFDNDGVLVEVRERDVFREEAGMQMVNGFLIPGFVDVMPKALLISTEEELVGYIKRQYISCTKVIGLPESVLIKTHTMRFPGLEFVPFCSASEFVDDSFESAFEKLKKSNADVNGLMNYTKGNAIRLGVEKLYGSFLVGSTPGLLALSKVDYTNFSISDQTKVKKIL